MGRMAQSLGRFGFACREQRLELSILPVNSIKNCQNADNKSRDFKLSVSWEARKQGQISDRICLKVICTRYTQIKNSACQAPKSKIQNLGSQNETKLAHKVVWLEKPRKWPKKRKSNCWLESKMRFCIYFQTRIARENAPIEPRRRVH